MQPFQQLEHADTGTPSRHRDKLRLCKRAPRRRRWMNLSQVLRSKQQIRLHQHPPDHILIDAVIIDVEGIETHKPRKGLMGYGLRGDQIRVADTALKLILLLFERLSGCIHL